MTWVVGLFALVYAALKAGQFAFLGRHAGYRQERVELGTRLRIGEPWLLAIAFLLTVPPALVARWYHQHKFTAMLQEAITCYGIIDSYADTPTTSSHRSFQRYETLYEERAIAFDASRQLGVPAALTREQLDRASRTFAAERAHAGSALRRIRLAELRECLEPSAAGPNS